MPDFAESKETLDEGIDRAKAAALDLEVNAQKVAFNTIGEAARTIHGVLAELLAAENNIIAGLDGWHLDVTASITLRRPK